VETQNWVATNGGHDMVGAMEGNAAKSSIETPARILDIFNAYRPAATRLRSGPDGVGEHAGRQPDGDGLRRHVGLARGPPERAAPAAVAPSVVRSIAGDATWLDTGRTVAS
jgi:hypothetical protein